MKFSFVVSKVWQILSQFKQFFWLQNLIQFQFFPIFLFTTMWKFAPTKTLILQFSTIESNLINQSPSGIPNNASKIGLHLEVHILCMDKDLFFWWIFARFSCEKYMISTLIENFIWKKQVRGNRIPNCQIFMKSSNR